VSANLYESQIRQHERVLQDQRKKNADAVRKAATLERDVVGLMKQAQSAKSDGSRRSYLTRAEGKQRELRGAHDEEAKAARTIAAAEHSLSTARRNLAQAQATEKRRQAEKETREQRQRDQKERSEHQRREREAQKAERERGRREAKRDRDLSALRGRTTELEEQLIEAARRAAPNEITVLFLASSPEDQEALRLDKETREIQKQLRASKYRDSIWFEWRLARRTTDLIQDLNEVKPQVLHFSGHGSRAELVFEDENGNATMLDNDQLRTLLQVGGDPIRLVVFNSCESAAQAELACQHVDVAIGMEARIDDESAKTFAAQLYNSLGFGLSVADAFQQASLQVELAHGKDANEPRLFTASGVDASALVLVNPDAQ
jgi:hypothetical protein